MLQTQLIKLVCWDPTTHNNDFSANPSNLDQIIPCVFDWWSLMATLPLGSITKLYHCIFKHCTGIFIQPSSDKHDDSFTEHQTQQQIKWFTIRAWAAKLCALLLFTKTNALLPVGRTGETWLVFGEVLLFQWSSLLHLWEAYHQSLISSGTQNIQKQQLVRTLHLTIWTNQWNLAFMMNHIWVMMLIVLFFLDKILWKEIEPL